MHAEPRAHPGVPAARPGWIGHETELAHGAHRQHRGRGRTPWDKDREHREACAEQNARYYKDLARHARHRIPAEPRFNHPRAHGRVVPSSLWWECRPPGCGPGALARCGVNGATLERKIQILDLSHGLRQGHGSVAAVRDRARLLLAAGANQALLAP